MIDPLDGRDVLVKKHFGQRSLKSDKLAIDDHVASYGDDAWTPTIYSPLEDQRVAGGPSRVEIQPHATLLENDEAEPSGWSTVDWELAVRAASAPTHYLGMIRVSGSIDDELTIAIM
jgi:hypothetical protein